LILQTIHLQIIGFDTGGSTGEVKDNYIVFEEYRNLLDEVIEEVTSNTAGNKELE
jgi:hypothetical protein